MEQVQRAIHHITRSAGREFAVEWPGKTEGPVYQAVRAAVLATEAYHRDVFEGEERVVYTAKGQAEFRQKLARVAVLEVVKQDDIAFATLQRELRDVQARYKAAEREAVPDYERIPAAVHVDLAIVDSMEQAHRVGLAQRISERREIEAVEQVEVALALARLPSIVTGVSAEQRSALKSALVADLNPALVQTMDLLLAQMAAVSANSHARIRDIASHAPVPYNVLRSWSEKAWTLFSHVPGQVAAQPTFVPLSQNAAALADTAASGLPADMAPMAVQS